MNDSSIAVRYAKALFQSAQEAKKTESILVDLRFLEVLLKEVAEFSQIIESPIVQANDKLQILEKVLKGQIQDLSYRFIELITRNKRESYLPGMIRKYYQLYRKDQGIIRATLTTVAETKPAVLDDFKAFLKGNYQAEVELEQHLDEKLIGGFVLRIEDEQWDASIAAQLSKIKRELEQSLIR